MPENFRAQIFVGKSPCSNRDCTGEDVFVTVKRLDEIAHEVEADMLSGKILMK